MNAANVTYYQPCGEAIVWPHSGRRNSYCERRQLGKTLPFVRASFGSNRIMTLCGGVLSWTFHRHESSRVNRVMEVFSLEKGGGGGLPPDGP